MKQATKILKYCDLKEFIRICDYYALGNTDCSKDIDIVLGR